MSIDKNYPNAKTKKTMTTAIIIATALGGIFVAIAVHRSMRP